MLFFWLLKFLLILLSVYDIFLLYLLFQLDHLLFDGLIKGGKQILCPGLVVIVGVEEVVGRGLDRFHFGAHGIVEVFVVVCELLDIEEGILEGCLGDVERPVVIACLY